MTCQNCGHTPAAHTWQDDPERSDCGQPCDCTAYREPEPAGTVATDGQGNYFTVPDDIVPNEMRADILKDLSIAHTDLPDADAACLKCGHALSSADGCSECPTPAETAWEAWRETHAVPHWDGHGVSRAIFAAGFAAASGPWAEHLDAANAERDECGLRLNGFPDSIWPVDPGCVQWQYGACRCEAECPDDRKDALAAALARNAELEKWQANHGDCQTRILIAESDGDEYQAQRDALRAELDNLRDRVTALADDWETPGEFRGAGNNLARADCANELRAIVRGSDDE